MSKVNLDDGLEIQLTDEEVDYDHGIDFLIDRLNDQKGAFFSSGIEYPDRYSRWEIGFHNPPVEFIAIDRTVTVTALNQRGEVILELIKPYLTKDTSVEIKTDNPNRLELYVNNSDAFFEEEKRSHKPTVLTPIRTLTDHLTNAFKKIEADTGNKLLSVCGLYGAFAYDLIFQFDPITFHQDRSKKDKIFHLFLPDRLYALDRQKEKAQCLEIEFRKGDINTAEYAIEKEDTSKTTIIPETFEAPAITSDHKGSEYEKKVDIARERMRVGDIFEVVLRREFKTSFQASQSSLFKRFRKINPSPYEFFCAFGDESLIGTSPEMFVRVDGKRIESCPISGTIRRSGNPMEDAEQLRLLMNSEKDEVELTMCTDVDRNDKSRVCEAGSVKLLGRRQVEEYAGLYHTVDHVEGQLREGFTAIDGFLSHMWAVTLTGAPKKWAVQIIEEQEKSPRAWYGGAIGSINFNGNMNTGITIRTMHLKDNQVKYNVGATLVYDSEGDLEELETRTKATAFFKLFGQASTKNTMDTKPIITGKFLGKKIIMVDNEDSFVNTLSDYFRQMGADVSTYRSPVSAEKIIALNPDMVVHSPGPGKPEQFGVPKLVFELSQHNVPQFGICLGLQGMVEAFGGKLRLLETPRHGKRWTLKHKQADIFEGLPSPCLVGAYHSIVADEDSFPGCLEVLAENESGLIMAIKHKTKPIRAVQFHPESILTMSGNTGLRLIENLMKTLP